MRHIIMMLLALLVSSIAICEDSWVNGYYRRDGTYVEGYSRSRPNAYNWDNKNYRENEPAYNDTYYSPKSNYNSNWYKPSETRFNDKNPYNDNQPLNNYGTNNRNEYNWFK